MEGSTVMLIAEIENKYKTLNPPEDRIKRVHPTDPAAPVFRKELEAEFSKIHRRNPGVVLRTGDPRQRDAGLNQEGEPSERRHGEKRQSGGSFKERQIALIALERKGQPLRSGDRIYVESESTAPGITAPQDRASTRTGTEIQPPEKDGETDFIVDLTPTPAPE